MTWTELIDAYLEDRRMRLAPVTIARYRRDLVDWLSFCDEAGLREPGAVLRVHLETFHSWLRRRPSAAPQGRLGTTSISKKLWLVGALLEWAARRDLVLIGPGPLERPHSSSPLPRVLSVHQVEALLEAPDPDTPIGRRDRAILETFYGTGVRRAECCALRLDDLDLAARSLRIRSGKGAKDRLLPIGEHLAGVLERYLECRHRLGPRADTRALFVATQTGGHLTGQGMQGVAVRNSRRAGIHPAVRPHALRHALAVHLLENGAQLVAVKALLGHSSLQSTDLYTQLVPAELRREHRRTHPRARRRRT